MLKKKYIGFIAGAIVLIVIISAYYLSNTKELYGNDKESIVKVIHSIEGYESKSIEILGIKDINEVRVVAFLSNNGPAYIQFTKNSEGNYKWNHIEVRRNETISSFLLHFRKENPKFLFVTTNENEIVKMQVSVNGQLLEQKFRPNEAAVTWTDLPSTNKSEYTFRNYKYFDKDGNPIEG